uniref:NR LBD domain-containing protein n=1 Tax=Panagrolaimus davidi TaxID=227884 RepID=A0A914P8F1_9BILA
MFISVFIGILTTKEYICKRNGKCDIKKGERCRACRFTKCITAGMNPAAIKLPDNIDINSVMKHVENHRKRILPFSNETEADPEEPETSVTVYNKLTPIFNQSRQSQEIDFLLFLELKVQKLRESNYNPVPLYFTNIDEILKRQTELRNSDRYIKPPTWPIEKQDLEIMYTTPPPPGPPKRMWMAIDVIICIEMAKTLPFFDKLETSDQLALLKHVTLMNAILTQCYYSYTNHSDVIMLPDGLTPIRFSLNSGNLGYDVYCRPIEPLKRINITKEEYVLLKTLVFCYPAANDISDKGKKILEKEFDKYSKLLLNHIQAQIGAAPGAVKYGQVIAILEALTHFSEKKKEHHIMMSMLRVSETNHPAFTILDEVHN